MPLSSEAGKISILDVGSHLPHDLERACLQDETMRMRDLEPVDGKGETDQRH